MIKDKLKKYPDGTSYFDFGSDGGEIGQELIFKVNSYEDLWHLNQMVNAHGGYPTVTIPNLIDSQADRKFGEGQSSGLKLVCQFLNEMPAFFKIFHPHNPEVVEALLDNVEIIDNSDFIFNHVITKYLGGEHNFISHAENNLILMSSDAGGFKPLMKICKKLNGSMSEWRGETYSAAKSRKYENGISKLVQLVDKQDFKGKDVLIVDDLSIGGGTFKGLSKLLKQRNVGKLYLAVSHMTVQDLGDDPVTNYFDKVFTTNSKFDSYYGKYAKGSDRTVQPKNLEIIKMF